MMDVARETTIVTDSIKPGRRSLSRIRSADRIHRLITDTGAPNEFLTALQARGVEVVTV